jgi:hypothetical protein
MQACSRQQTHKQAPFNAAIRSADLCIASHLPVSGLVVPPVRAGASAPYGASVARMLGVHPAARACSPLGLEASLSW